MNISLDGPDRFLERDSITSDYKDNTQHVGIINRNIQSWRTNLEGEGKAVNVLGDMKNCTHYTAIALAMMQWKHIPTGSDRSKLEAPPGRIEPLTDAPYTSIIVACSDADNPTLITEAYVKTTPDTGRTNDGFLACLKSSSVQRKYQVRRSHIVGMDMNDSDRRHLRARKCDPASYVKVPVVHRNEHNWTASGDEFKQAILDSEQFIAIEDKIRNTNDCCAFASWSFWYYKDPKKNPKTHMTALYMHGREFMSIDMQQSLPPPRGAKARRAWCRRHVAQRALHRIGSTDPQGVRS